MVRERVQTRARNPIRIYTPVENQWKNSRGGEEEKSVCTPNLYRNVNCPLHRCLARNVQAKKMQLKKWSRFNRAYYNSTLISLRLHAY